MERVDSTIFWRVIKNSALGNEILKAAVASHGGFLVHESVKG